MGDAIEIAAPVLALWDEMADFDVANSDGAFEHQLKFLHTQFDAMNVSWLAAIRVQDGEAGNAAQVVFSMQLA
ncbi:MAG: hypothetical protein P8015_11445 [Acidihalobacter sp.]|jgi:hypothetical protein